VLARPSSTIALEMLDLVLLRLVVRRFRRRCRCRCSRRGSVMLMRCVMLTRSRVALPRRSSVSTLLQILWMLLSFRHRRRRLCRHRRLRHDDRSVRLARAMTLASVSLRTKIRPAMARPSSVARAKLSLLSQHLRMLLFARVCRRRRRCLQV
jgi:hypothetical protein